MAIIAAVDFSPVSARAAEVAEHWAERTGEPLILVHVVTPPRGAPQELAASMSSFIPALKEDAGQRLESLKSGLSRPGVALRTEILLGNPDEELAAFAAAEGASMVVLGTHGRGAAARFFLGGVAERVVKLVACPLLVVPAVAYEGLVQRPRSDVLRIVAALTTGPAGDAVRAWLVRLREKEACDVTFVHVFDAEAEHERLGIEGPYEDQGDNPELLAVLRRELRPLINLPGTGATALVIRPNWGKRPDPLVFEAVTDDADVIVLGTRSGHGLSARAGLVTVRTAHVPVLCVPSGTEKGEREIDSAIPVLKRLLVPTDFSELGNRAIMHAYQLLRAGGGRMELCHVVPETDDGLAPAKAAELRRQLEALIPLEAELRGIRTRVFVIVSEAPAHAIVQAAERLGADMIVLATHGRGGLARTVLGSVTDAVVRGAHRPVVVVGPPAPAPA